MRPNLPPASSYYNASSPANLEHPRPPLAGELETDIAVVGGGLAGCSAALHLAKRGFRVALLEANFVGYGASGRSGGQTIFGLATSQKALVSQVGREDAKRLFEMSVEALDLNQSLIHEYGIECDYRPNHVHVATKPRHLVELRDWLDSFAASTIIARCTCSTGRSCKPTCAARAISAACWIRAAGICTR